MGWSDGIRDWLTRTLTGRSDEPPPEPKPSEVLAHEKRFSPLWDAYFGRFPQPRGVKKGEKPVAVNYVRTIVLKSADALFGQPFQVETGDQKLDADVEAWLEEQGGLSFWHSVAVTGAVTGLAAVWLLRDGSIAEVDTSYLELVPEPDDWRSLRRAVLYIGGNRRKVTEKTADGRAWEIRVERKGNDQGAMTQWVTEGEPELWPFPFPPVAYCQNLPAPHEVWGISEAEVVLPLNMSLNAALTHAEKVVHRFVAPRLVGFGFRRDQAKPFSEEQMLVVEEKGGRVDTIEPHADLPGLMGYLAEIRSMMLEVSQTPDIALGRLRDASLGNSTGVALRVLYQPLLDKLETKRRLYGHMLTTTIQRWAVVTGRTREMPDVTIRWPELLPRNEKEARENAIIDQQLGVSTYTILRSLGYDPVKEALLREKDAAALGEAVVAAFDRGEVD